MKPFIRLALLSISLALFPLAEARSHDGTIYITGTIKNKTCVISPDSEHLVVTMTQVNATQLEKAKNETPYERFTINVEQCGAGLNTITTRFEGTPDGQNNALLAITEAQDSASGVAIGLFNTDKSPLPLSGESLPFVLTGNQTTAELVFFARYLAVTDTVTPGTANAAATFVLTYA